MAKPQNPSVKELSAPAAVAAPASEQSLGEIVVTGADFKTLSGAMNAAPKLDPNPSILSSGASGRHAIDAAAGLTKCYVGDFCGDVGAPFRLIIEEPVTLGGLGGIASLKIGKIDLIIPLKQPSRPR